MSDKVLTLENQIESRFQEWVEKHFPGESGLKTRKLEAIRKFQSIGLPAKKSEAYKYTPISRILEKNIDFSIIGGTASWTREECQERFYQVEEANHLVFVNGVFHIDYSVIKSPSDSLEIRLLDAQTFTEHAEVREALGKTGDQSQDAFAAMNLACFNQGLYLKASKNSDNLPTFVYHYIDATEAQAVLFPRILVVGESSSRTPIYEKSFTKGAFTTFSNSILETEVKENAVVNYTKIQNYQPSNFVIDGIYGHQHRDSRFYTNTFSFKGALIRNNIYISIDDENCEAHMHGLYLLSGKSHVDNNTSVDHRKPHSFSNELYKGIIDEQAKAVFNGKIYVRPDAQKTNAFQANNNIILSDTATVNTKPQLEIWADDVQCSHGCTTGQLDDEAIFYLRSRGIGKKKAKALVLNAFANETLAEVKDELVKEEIQGIILNKLDS